MRSSIRGVAALELLIVLPFYMIILFFVFFLGDMMFIQQKAEVAARYAGWGKGAQSKAAVDERFFKGVSHRKNIYSTLPNSRQVGIQSLTDKSGGGTKYPASENQSAELRTRFLDDKLPHAGTKDVAHIAFEGKFGYYRGGWTREHQAAVRVRYFVIAFRKIGLKHVDLGAASFVLQGKTASTEMDESGFFTPFTFRDNDPEKKKPDDADLFAQQDHSAVKSDVIKKLRPKVNIP